MAIFNSYVKLPEGNQQKTAPVIGDGFWDMAVRRWSGITSRIPVVYDL